MTSPRRSAAARVAAIAVAIATMVASPGQAAAPQSTISVARPVDQSSSVGAAITPFRVDATSPDPSRILMYSASGLPDGLMMSTVIGSISGTPTAAGTFVVTINVADGAGVTGATTFTWTVKPSGSEPAAYIPGGLGPE
jgi:F0F1-type ATP synthase membrane subunit c/vacuolar-type H+-ATPase subunit K